MLLFYLIWALLMTLAWVFTFVRLIKTPRFNGKGDKNRSIHKLAPKFKVTKIESERTYNPTDNVCKYTLSNNHFLENAVDYEDNTFEMYAPNGKYQIGDVLTLENINNLKDFEF